MTPHTLGLIGSLLALAAGATIVFTRHHAIGRQLLLPAMLVMAIAFVLMLASLPA